MSNEHFHIEPVAPEHWMNLDFFSLPRQQGTGTSGTWPSFREGEQWHRSSPGTTARLGATSALALANGLLSYAEQEIHAERDHMSSCFRAYDRAINGLLKVRDFLGLQLDHALGNIDEDSFGMEAERYLNDRDRPLDWETEEAIQILLKCSHSRLDPETISEVFECYSEDAERVYLAVRTSGSITQV